MNDCKCFFSQNLGSDALNYAALSFHPKAKSSRRPASENQVESNVVYAATRQSQGTSGTAAQSGTNFAISSKTFYSLFMHSFIHSLLKFLFFFPAKVTVFACFVCLSSQSERISSVFYGGGVSKDTVDCSESLMIIIRWRSATVEE